MRFASRASRHAAGWLMVMSIAATLVACPVRAEPSGADIQWAQTILNEKGFKVGRANGQMTAKTREMLAAYQKSVGLKASGELDAATVAKMMDGRQQAGAPKTMRSLGAGGSNATQPRISGPEPKPMAAPTARIGTSGPANETFIGSVVRGPSGTPPSASRAPAASAASSYTAPAAPGRTAASAPSGRTMAAAPVPAPARPVTTAAGHAVSGGLAQNSHVPSGTALSRVSANNGGAHPVPLAAPRQTVTAEGATATGGAPVPAMAPPAAESGGWSIPNWLRYGVMGLIASVLGIIGYWWWSAGRGGNGIADENVHEYPPVRREPTFAGPASSPEPRSSTLTARRP